MSLGPELLRVVPNPFFGIITNPTSSLSARTVEYRQLLRPYPQYQDVGIHRRPQAQSTYHALTVRGEKRFSQGFSFLLAYTAAKSIDDGSAVAWWEGPTSRSFLDHYNRRLERSISSWDVAQRFVMSYVYELPLGRGKRFGATLPRGLAGERHHDHPKRDAADHRRVAEQYRDLHTKPAPERQRKFRAAHRRHCG
jgi:hypothetical protein